MSLSRIRVDRLRAPRRRWPGVVLAATALVLSAPVSTPSREPLPEGWTRRVDSRLSVVSREEDGGWAERLLQGAGPVFRRFTVLLGDEAGEPIEVVLLPETSGDGGPATPRAPDWAAGFTVAGSNVLFIRLDSLGLYPDRDLESIFAHELGHAVFARLLRGRRLPRWFEEGACMVLARPWDLRDSLTLTAASLFHTDTDLSGYAEAFPREAAAARAAYARSFSFMSWLVERHGGLRPVGQVARRVGAGERFEAAFTAEYGVTVDQAARRWRAAVGRWYRVVSIVTASTTFWLVTIALLTLVFLRKRRRQRRILEAWEFEERAAGRVPDDPIVPR